MADIRINALATTATTPASDDYLALDGTAQGTRKILATNIANNVTDVILGASGPSVKSTLSARAPRQGLVFDGSAKIPFSLAAFGTNPATIHFWFNPATFSGNPRLIGASSAIQLLLDASGAQFYTAGGSVYGSALTVGKTTAVTVVINGNGTAVVYTNGVAGTSGNITANLSTAIDTLGGLASGSVFSGVMSPLIYNRALSASEVVSLYEAGAPAGADYNSASNTAINTNTAVDGVAGNNTFAATAGGSFTGASATGFTAVSGGGAYAAASFQPNFTVQPGQIIRVTYTATVNSGTVLASLMNSSVSSISSSHTVTTGTRTVEFVATAASTSARVIFGSSGGSACNFSVSSVSVVRSGLLLAPDAAQAGGGLVWYDTSGNAANITLPASGVTWNVPSSLKTASGWTFGGKSAINAAATYNSDTAYGLSVGDSTNTNSAIHFGYDAAINAGFVQAATFGSQFRNLLLQPNGQKVLIGTPTDSGNGVLQLATHTTSAGGIGFGTDTSLYRGASGIGTLELSASTGTVSIFKVALAGTAKAQFGIAAGATYIDYDGSLLVRNGIGGTTALTLDSSQNATFAGAITGKQTIAFPATANAVTIPNGISLSSGYSVGYLSFYNGSGGKVDGYVTSNNLIISDNVRMAGLPTSSAGLSSGQLWIDTANGRVIKVVA